MTLTFTDNPKFIFLYYLQSVFVLLSLKNENLHLLIPVVFVSCGHGMQSTVFHELHIHLIPGTSNLDSLYLISGPCSFSKFIACCITCHRNGTESFSLMSPDISILNSKVSLYPAAPHGLASSSVYEILWDI